MPTLPHFHRLRLRRFHPQQQSVNHVVAREGVSSRSRSAKRCPEFSGGLMIIVCWQV
jgi:hypothetical protein